MKQTDFRFQLQITSGDPQSTLSVLASRLREIKGIDELRFSVGGDLAVMIARAAFDNKEDAKRIHRKVMQTLMNCSRIRIVEATSILSDIF
jgi:hypothetical protein